MLDKIKNKRIIIAIVLLILIFSFYFTYYLYQIYSHSDTNLKDKEYTAAIVLTGDQYRIQKGISLLKENIRINKTIAIIILLFLILSSIIY